MWHPEPPRFSKRKALNPGKGWDGMSLASLQKPSSSSRGGEGPLPGLSNVAWLRLGLCFHPALCPPPCRGPNCEEGLGSIFSVLILYFPFPPHNIKHNFALSVSLRLRFVDVSTWKHDPSASNGESSLRSLWEAASPPRLSGFLEHPKRERETAIKAIRVPTRTPQSFQIPSPCDSRSQCVFDVRLVVGLFV